MERRGGRGGNTCRVAKRSDCSRSIDGDCGGFGAGLVLGRHVEPAFSFGHLKLTKQKEMPLLLEGRRMRSGEGKAPAQAHKQAMCRHAGGCSSGGRACQGRK
jgi:hypothetical protein